MSTPPPQEGEEGVFAHIMRSTRNACTKCFGCLQTSDEKAKIKYKEYQIANRKKAFGVEYIDLMENKSSEADLKACVDKCLEDVDKIKKEIEVLEKEVERVDTVTKSKLVHKSGAAPAAAAAATTTTPAEPEPAVIEEPATTEAPAPAAAPEPAPAKTEETTTTEEPAKTEAQ